MKLNWTARLSFIAIFWVSAVYGAAPLFLPPVAPASVPADQFSAGRAMGYLQALAASPRVVGTPGMEGAAAYVAEALRVCGIEHEVQSAPSPRGMLHNVVARLPGSRSSGALLILTHVDSVSYGAGDNASGAAVLLEAACALRAGEPLNNDIILLFEDGEEAGYLGGYAFVKGDARLASVRRVVGLDTAAWGPVVLLQTTPGNAGFIRAYASSVRHPVALGFFADADWTISQDTSEIQPFYEAGIPGLELEDPTAFSGKHSDADAVDQVKPGSLQQMGDQVLSLARGLGDADLTISSGGSLSYFTLWGIGVVRYPATWNLVFALLAAICLGASILRRIKQGACSARDPILAAAGISLAFAGAVLIGAVGNLTFPRLFQNSNPRIDSYLTPASLPFFLIFLGLAALVYLAVRWMLVRRLGAPAVNIGGLLFWLLVSFVMAALLPVGSYLFTLPTLAAALVGLSPTQWRFANWQPARIIPGALAAILFIPNLVLAFLGTGMETLALVTFFAALNLALWSSADERIP